LNDRLVSAEAKLKKALADPDLSEGDKQQLKDAFASTKKAFTLKAIKDAFPEQEAIPASSGSFQSSSTE
jgi:hypothetical protein